jgi:hypothetical protein
MRAWVGVRFVLAAITLFATNAFADDPAKRPYPDYEGRPRRGSSAGEVALWVPRVVFSPVYFTCEYLLRRPIGALVTEAERSNVPQVLYDFFAFGPDHKAGIAPIAFVDFGFNPSVGGYAFWDDALFVGNDLRAHVSVWTDDWIASSLVGRVRFHGKGTAALTLLGIRRPDYVFYGIGPNAPNSARSRYREDRMEAGGLVEFGFWRASKMQAGAGVRASSFRDGRFGGDRGIVESAAAGAFPLPDGFARGYTAEYNRVLLALDSRRPFPSDGSGLRVEGLAEQGSDLRQAAGSGWIRWAGSAGGFFDFDGHRRVVSLTGTALFSDPIGPRPVPFTELVAVGGDSPGPGSFPATMQGFLTGRLVDRSAAVGTLRYKWPVGPWISGSIQGAVGNVFGERLAGFDARSLRFSGTMGLESDSSPDSNFDAIVGIGTDTFEHGAHVESVRLAVGVSRF